MESEATSTEVGAHVSIDELTGLRAGTLEGPEVLRVARHLAQCRRCAAAARQLQDARGVAAGFREALRDDEPATAATTTRLRPLIAVAAVVVIAIVAAAFFLARRPEAPTPRGPSAVIRTTPQPLDYGRADWNALVSRALASGRVDTPNLSELQPSGVSVRALGSEAQRLEPTGIVVESDRPRFTWPRVPNAVTYAVHVYRGEHAVARSGELRALSWTPNEPLERGAKYQWQVMATKADGSMEALPSPPTPPALFRVLSSAAAADLAEARRRFPNDSLLAGILEARAGLFDDARRDLASASRLRDSLPPTGH